MISRRLRQTSPLRSPSWVLLGIIVAGFASLSARADEPKSPPDFGRQIEPILTEYCYECHGAGEKKGGVAFDELTDDQRLHSPDLWWKVLRNVRSHVMPPADKPRPSAEEQGLLADWIKYQGLGIDYRAPDPGRVTLRRLNRAEYRNTIRDLMGYDFNTNEEFPADDSGYGFDNIGDVLSVSPLLLEKYLNAAEAIVTAAVPTAPKSIEETTIPGTKFKDAQKKTHDLLSFYQPAALDAKFHAQFDGQYKLYVTLQVKGQFSFDPGRCRTRFTIDGQQRLEHEYSWEASKKFEEMIDQHFSAGDHRLKLELEPLTPVDQRVNSLDLQLVSVRIEGPLDPTHWTPTKNYDRFFSRDEPPTDLGERRAYGREVIGRFVRQAFRRPVDEQTIDRLVALAEQHYAQPGKRFEEGIQQAFVAVLASPRFLFRLESTEPLQGDERYPLVDEYALASRLSYFLWSSMPDAELLELAERHELRAHLAKQVRRMVDDPRFDGFVQNFVGQWLQVRDVEGIAVDAPAIVARDNAGLRKLMSAVDNVKIEFVRRGLEVLLEYLEERIDFSNALRKAMRQEAEMMFAYVVHEDRNLLELVDCDYTFANRLLSAYYGLPAVKDESMQRVTLPAGSPRGGVLTMGAVLVVTSNPDRTSPVKRGLFILDNILGSPPPPPPANVPALEVAEKGVRGRTPTMRESLEIHRVRPLCSSCHSRMDPLGLGFENFNALGRWRDSDRGAEIDSRGSLATGESFESVRELKRIIAQQHSDEFYRCFTEKLYTYALGRGLTYVDVDQVDALVGQLEQGGGRFSQLLEGMIESPQFQRRRESVDAPEPAREGKP